MLSNILNISLDTKILKKIRPFYIFLPQMIIYKRNFDENRHIYFFIKQEKVFIKYLEIFEKIRKIIKKKF